MWSLVIFLLSFSLCSVIALDKDWWVHSSIYDIFIWSFKDSNGDGIGDLDGLTSKLDYLHDLGVDVIQLSPIYSSSESISKNYGIDNFTDIHSTVGTLEDFDEFIREAEVKGIKIILKINLNYCSIKHEWFQKAVDGVEPYKDYFIWKEKNKDFDSRVEYGWYLTKENDRYYKASYDNTKPDLNLKNKSVKKEIDQIMRFWFDRGVSGFNIEKKDVYFSRRKYSYKTDSTDEEDFYDLLRELREFIDTYNDGVIKHERILTTDGGKDLTFILRYIGNKDLPLAHFVSTTNIREEYSSYNFEILSAKELQQKFTKFSKKELRLPIQWVVYTYENNRPIFKCDHYSNIFFTITAVLPGIWHLTYGSELGMKSYTHKKVSNTGTYEYTNRNTLPMQWDDSKNAGFSDSDYPIQFPNPDYWNVNVLREQQEDISTYRYIQSLLMLRKEETIKYGDLKYSFITDWVLAIIRTYKEHATITLINSANFIQSVNLNAALKNILDLQTQLKVIAATPNSIQQKGDKISKLHFTLRPFSALVLAPEK